MSGCEYSELELSYASPYFGLEPKLDEPDFRPQPATIMRPWQSDNQKSDVELVVENSTISKPKENRLKQDTNGGFVLKLKRPVYKTYEHPFRQEAIRLEIELAKVTSSHRSTPMMGNLTFKQATPPYIKLRRNVKL